jgi:hypothetical protein
MIKTFTLLRRNQAVSRDRFAERWDALDAEVSRAYSAGPSGLVHGSALQLGTTAAPYDGVTVAWYPDESSYGQFAASLAADTAHGRDWAEIVDTGSTVELIVEERVVRGEEWIAERWSTRAEDTVFMLTAFIERRAATTRDAFRDYWWLDHRPLANRLIPPDAQGSAYLQNVVIGDVPSQWDGVGELYLDSLAQLPPRAAFFGGEASAELVADERRFMEHKSRVILVTDHRLIVRS